MASPNSRQSANPKNAILRFPVDESPQQGFVLKPVAFETLASGIGAQRNKGVPNVMSTSRSFGHIFLPMPTNMTDRVGVNYSGVDLGVAQLSFNAGQTIGSMADAAGSAAQVGSYLGRTALAAASSGTGALSAQLIGNVPNPYSTQLFERVEQRAFSFEFRLIANSEADSHAIKEIVNAIRYFSLPAEKGGFLEMPHEWELAFYGSEFLFDFSRCVVTEVTINFAGDGLPVFLPNAAPRRVDLTISFKEIIPLTKQLIDESGSSTMKPSDAIKGKVNASSPPTVPQNEAFNAIANQTNSDPSGGG